MDFSAIPMGGFREAKLYELQLVESGGWQIAVPYRFCVDGGKRASMEIAPIVGTHARTLFTSRLIPDLAVAMAPSFPEVSYPAREPLKEVLRSLSAASEA